MARQTAALGISIAQLGHQGLRVLRDELVQHGALGSPPAVAAEPLSGRAGRSFVEAAHEHTPAH